MNAYKNFKYFIKVAFEAGEILGIPRVLEPESMAIRKIPDKLAVITYLHQLRSSLGNIISYYEINGMFFCLFV